MLRIRFIGLFLILSFGLSACLEPAPVNPSNPKPENQSPASSVTFSLPRTALADLSSSAQSLTIRAFKGVGAALGEELREAYKFPITERGLYALEGLPLGEITLVITLLGESEETLAEGTLEATINPGEQTLPQVILKPKKITPVGLNLQVALKLTNFPNSSATLLAEPEAVRAIFKAYNCQVCHNSGLKPKGDLDLKSYPYKNLEKESLTKILDLVIQSVSGSGNLSIMPPASQPTVKADEVTTLKNFLQALNENASAGSDTWIKEVNISLSIGGPGRLNSTLVLKDGLYTLADSLSLMAGSRYAYSLTVFGPGGSRLYEVQDAVLDVPLDGKVLLNFDILYQTPTVTLPIGVGPSLN